jgi:hypothetical protein
MARLILAYIFALLAKAMQEHTLLQKLVILLRDFAMTKSARIFMFLDVSVESIPPWNDL